MENPTGQIVEYIQGIERVLEVDKTVEIEPILNQVIQIIYYLIDKLESLTLELDFKSLQFEQEIGLLKKEFENQQSLTQEFSQKYYSQLQHNYVLELNLEKIEHKLLTSNKESEQEIQMYKENHKYLIQQLEQNRKEVRQLEQESTNLKRKIFELENEKIQIETENRIWKEKLESKYHQPATQVSQLTINQSCNQLNSLKNVFNTITDFFHEQKFVKQDQLCCFPSLNLIEDVSIASSKLLSNELPVKSTKSIFTKKNNTHINNPYIVFYKLICQCVKLDLQQPSIFEKNIDNYYYQLIEQKIPFNKWYFNIQKELTK